MLTKLASRALQSASGRSVVLGQKLGGGGEGTVYAVEGDPSMAAKIYNLALSKDRANKLEVMLSVGHADLFAVTAWPRDLLLQNGHLVGFVMPKAADAHEVHVLYGPKSRKQTFPNAGYRFLVHVAMNIARGFAVVHKHGLVVGDINERIALVGREGTVCLIDCDSFQLTSAGQTFLCEVGVPTFTPPELQNVLSFRGVPRTEQHDLFGVAVLLFHMLFFGRHPFSGRHQTNPEMPLETAIRECRFAYAPDRERTLIVAPPNAPTLATAGGPIAVLFEQAFSPAAARGAIARPSASQWADALHQLLGQLTSCSHNAAHAYVGSLSACPWCAMEMTSRVELFNYSAPAGQSIAKLDVDAIWQAIDGIPTIALKPAAAIHTASTQQVQLSAEAVILVRARAAMDKLQRATSVRLAAQRKLAAHEQRFDAAAVSLADAAASVDRYPDDVSRLGALETQLGRKQRALGRAARLTRGLVWCVGPVLLGIAAAMQASPTVLPALAGPLMIVLASYYTYMRLDVRVALLKRDAEALQKTVKRGLPHRQKEVSLRTSQLRAAKDEVLQCQGLVYECMTRESAAKAELVPQDQLDAAATILRRQHQAVSQRYHQAVSQYRHAETEFAHADAKARTLKDEAVKLCWAIRSIESRRAKEHRKTREGARESQLQDHLDGFFIAQEKWPRIPRAALSALASYGIETAVDVERNAVLKVPGFGAARTKLLLDWRKQKEATFRFNAKKSDQSSRMQAIDRRLDAERQAHERVLGKLHRQLEMTANALLQRKAILEQEMEKAARGFAATGHILQAVNSTRNVRSPSKP